MTRWLTVVALILTTSLGVIASPRTEQPDPLVGKWIWYKDVFAVFSEDGTCESNGLKGTWHYLNNPEVQRKYRVIWKDGVFINNVVMAENRQSLSVQDNNNSKFTPRRAAPAP